MTERIWTIESYQERMAEIAIQEKARREQAKAAKAARPGLGDPCIISGKAVKTRVASADEDSSYADVCWKREECSPIKDAMFIGFRSMRNGGWQHYRSYSDPGDDAWYFSPSESIEVWLFVTDPRRKPIMAFPEDVQQESEGNV